MRDIWAVSAQASGEAWCGAGSSALGAFLEMNGKK